MALILVGVAMIDDSWHTAQGVLVIVGGGALILARRPVAQALVDWPWTTVNLRQATFAVALSGALMIAFALGSLAGYFP